ncbi:hypothetical protein J6590_082301 [Homalodisca vitripennis]|nr:hypothetical protein J6590_082301 [Homalodisca vitripennis]
MKILGDSREEHRCGHVLLQKFVNRSNPRTSSRIPVTAAEPLPTRPQRSSTTPLPTTLELPIAAHPHVLPYDSFAEAQKSGSSNTQSATNKVDELMLMAEELRPDIFVVSEHGFTADTVAMFRINNYIG